MSKNREDIFKGRLPQVSFDNRLSIHSSSIINFMEEIGDPFKVLTILELGYKLPLHLHTPRVSLWGQEYYKQLIGCWKHLPTKSLKFPRGSSCLTKREGKTSGFRQKPVEEFTIGCELYSDLCTLRKSRSWKTWLYSFPAQVLIMSTMSAQRSIPASLNLVLPPKMASFISR